MLTCIDIKRVADDLRTYLYEHRYSYLDFAEISGVSGSTVCRVIKNKQIPRIDTLKKIVKAMNKSVDEYMPSSDQIMIDINCIDIRELSLEEVESLIGKLRAYQKRLLTSDIERLQHEIDLKKGMMRDEWNK